MIIELSTGKYLHTAYSITNIPEEMTTLDNEWSLTSQDGMDYIGTFIDGSSTESTDPNDYAWEELIDEDLDDIDEDGDIPVDDFQTQIDELQDQVTVNQDNIRSINASIENVQTNVASNSELSSATADIANATNQHFWTDENGVHVSNEEANAEGERNTVFNSIGMIFRKGANYLTAILAGGASGTDPKGLAIYDGQGNSDENVVASFTDSGSVIGKQNDGQLLLKNNYLRILNKEGNNVFSVENIQTTTQGIGFDVFVRREDEKNIGTYTHTIPDYLGGLAVHIYFNKPGSSGGVSDIIGLANFGNWSINSTTPNFQASGSVSFNANTNTLTVTVTSVSDSEFYVDLACSYDTYVRYPQIKIKPDSTTQGFSTTHKVFVIDDIDDTGNLFWIKDNGDLWSINNITAKNHVIGIVETGTTSNSWDYRLWSDGTYEAWRSHGFTGMALTSSSAGTYYGGGTTLGVPTFPNNSNTGVTQCLCTASNAFSHSSGVYLYQTEHASATTATSNLTFQFRAHASTNNAACGLDIYLKGTYS